MEVSERLQAAFPHLATSKYRVTSKRSGGYNCVAWAINRSDKWLDPSEFFEWPDGLPRDETVQAYEAFFRNEGFSSCPLPDCEVGFEKVAIYVDGSGLPQHVARQRLNGRWTSKLGKWEDIEHELWGLEASSYGAARIFMKRKLNIFLRLVQHTIGRR